ncbi:transposase, IS605 OrfB family [Halothece sp. PCC 7418]|uniref:RNA-guided endonuclease InsQ/TnpB family protein n=1 Tax=Halothece sp. (strain PCC 7418) TaxID=65093 RepID=UPI0002A063A8|nr:RNA-guided endonuclease TnpB family protein [Halothece sp. PCC 7418]AFZ45878.1 transposase, IS605 OrfB family [Halothece sp. PCC 7418]
MRRAIKIRLYPTPSQQSQLNQIMGCARYWWNYALALCKQHYKDTGKGLGRTALNSYLPNLKRQEETAFLKDCPSQVLQATTLNLTRAYKNFFEGRARYPRFKSFYQKQSCQFPQSVKIVDNKALKLPKMKGLVKAKIHRLFEDGKLKTVTISRTPTGKYYASLLIETQQEEPTPVTEGKVAGIDLGIKEFAIVHDGEKCSKFPNPKNLSKHEKNLKRKQKKLARKQKGSQSRNKARKLVAKVHERVSNTRQDYLHKVSRKIVDNNQVVVVENPSVHLNSIQVLADGRIPRLNIKGMVRNHKLAKAISDVSWGMFVNFLDYKLKEKGGVLVEIDRWFPSSKLCSNCHYELESLDLEVREWTCPKCGSHHERDENASKNIRAEGIRMLTVSGTGTAAVGGDRSPKLGRKVKFGHSPTSIEAPTKLTL